MPKQYPCIFCAEAAGVFGCWSQEDPLVVFSNLDFLLVHAG